MPTVGAAGAVTRTGVDMFDALPSEFTAAAAVTAVEDPRRQGQRHRHARTTRTGSSSRWTRSRRSCRRRRSPSRTAGSTSTAASTCVVSSAPLVSNASGAVNTSGGSTLTQQYVKLTLQDTALQGRRHTGRAGRGRPAGPGRRHPQAPGAEVLDPAREGADQGPDPPGLPQHRLLRRPGLRRAGGREALLQQGRQGPQPHRGGPDRRAGPEPRHDGPGEQPGTRHRATQRRPRPDARARPHHRQGGDRRQGGQAGRHAQGDVGPDRLPGVRRRLRILLRLRHQVARARPVAGAGARQDGRRAQGQDLRRRPDHPDDDRPRHRQARPRGGPQHGSRRGTPTRSAPPRSRSTPPPARCRAMAQNTKYILNSKNFGETVVNWAVDTKYGGSGGFQFGSTEKAFTLVTALEKGLPINTTVNAKQASPSQAASYTNADMPDPCGVPKGAPAWNVRNDETAGGADDDHPGDGPVDQHRVHRARPARSGSATCRTTETRMGLHRADGNPISKVGPVRHHPRDPGGLADDRRQRLRVAGQQRRSTARRSRSRASPAPTARSCRSTSRARRTASRSSTPRSHTASPAS